MALVYSTVPAVGAGVFTSNLVKAFCVQRNQKLANAGGEIRAFVANSGCANACTGSEGENNNQTEAQQMAELLGLPTDTVLTAATGVIGAQLPMEAVLHGVQLLKQNKQSGVEAALQADGPVVVDCRISPDVNVLPMIPPGGTVEDLMEEMD